MSKAVPDEPKFPIQLVWIESGDVETYEDARDLLCNLEEFDSNDPVDRNAARLTDALGRHISLVVRIYDDLCECKLE
ncbi:hypothetical protein Hneap_0079 [Halothiobacillus neapolitanus c2]|uniref:Uncharacterized protein n=1 Tax=Halothiobacillus neapolitanus (strain ATCC 23641 / DSM 15147 / CIP 104769 / NCIMB 8539 / c2) TaxID=555778 RepID=D0KWE7_HALNC|nr:hypothetical protein Hneap_0079 [Halothiobacillus neapolitanus c2]TDN57329.1 hypothetical protein C8D83_1176 [Halothiobacillus neapolitanus]